MNGSRYVVKVTNTGQQESFTSDEQPLELFGYTTWQSMKKGKLLPWIEVTEIKPDAAVNYFTGKGVLKLADADKHRLPWTTE